MLLLVTLFCLGNASEPAAQSAAESAAQVVLYSPTSASPRDSFVDRFAAALHRAGITLNRRRIGEGAEEAPNDLPSADVVVVHGPTLAAAVAGGSAVPLLVLLDDCSNGLNLPRWMRERQAPTLAQCLTLSAQQWLEPLLRLAPAKRRLGMIERAPPAPSRAMVRALVRRGVQLSARRVQSFAEVPEALRSLRQAIDVLWVPPRSVLLRAEYLPEILRFSLEETLPVLVPTRSLVRSGFLLSVEVDDAALIEMLVAAVQGLARRRAAVIPGTAPARHAVNVATARRLGIEVSAEALRWARDIFPFPFEVQDLLDRYAEAFRREDVALYEDVFWQPTVRQLKGFQRLVRTARDIRVRFETQRVAYPEGAAQMRLDVVQVFAFIDEKSGRSVSLRAPFQFRLERRDTTWRISGLRQSR